MPDLAELVVAIGRRLADIAAEMSALDAAKAELAAPRAGGHAPAITADGTTPRLRRRRTARGRVAPSPTPPGPATGSRTVEPVEAAQDVGGGVTRSRRKRAATATRARRGGGAVGVETLERLLADASAGLSANAIAKQADAGYGRTLKLLHELEAAGQVRRSGARRSTVWQLITDEERIAARAAELERLHGAPGRRRGRARAS